MGLKDYMAAMDSDDPTTALDWLDDDIHYLLALPAGVVTGHSKKDFADYIDSALPSSGSTTLPVIKWTGRPSSSWAR